MCCYTKSEYAAGKSLFSQTLPWPNPNSTKVCMGFLLAFIPLNSVSSCYQKALIDRVRRNSL